jgi:hypothetical protein
MHPVGVILANQRLAPLQIASYGHSSSSHGALIDFFIGGEQVEYFDRYHSYMVCALHDRCYCIGVADVRFLVTVTTACAKRTGAAASVERRRREPDRVISPE